MKKTLIVASRGGALAIAQTEIVISLLQKNYPDIDIRIKKTASEGDKDRRTTLWELKSTGFFTSRLEDTLMNGQADAAVHSFKDLPTAIREGLSIGAVLDRKFPEDCLVLAKPVKSIDELPNASKIGTSSLRRAVQLKRLREDLQCVAIRGNVNTRLRKLEQGDFDAIVLARAGLERLGLADRISIVFDPTQFISAPAQGAIAVQVRCDDAETKEIVSKLDDKDTRITTTAERLVFAALGCGCHAPAGAFAKISDNQITISACLSDPEGHNFVQSTLTGPVADYKTLAETLAAKLLQKDKL
ncbi:MAG: hydroxymethylbilane synthase [Planctomycetota bacterium]